MAQMIFPIMTDFDKKLPYFFAGVGCSYEQEPIDRPAGHSNFQWIQTYRGEGILHLRGKEYVLKEGMGMLLFPGEPHDYKKSGDEWLVDWVILEGAGISDFVRNILELKQSEVCSVRDVEMLSERIGEVFAVTASNEPMKNAICSKLVYSLLTDILRTGTFQTEKITAGNTRGLDAVISYIHLHFEKVLTLEALAEIANLTPQYLCTAFKRYTSQTVFQYINMVRVSKSKERLMAEVNRPIAEIACETGFHDASYFCKIFRRLEGKSPAEFRRLR